LAAADFNDQHERLEIEEPLPDPRLSSPQSGLYARVFSSSADIVWKSTSAIGLTIPRYTQADVGRWYFESLQDASGKQYFSQSFTVVWEVGQGRQFRYVFQVLENEGVFKKQVSGFRNALWGWLLAVSIILLIAQGVILQWSLKPLRDVAIDLDRVKAGKEDRLSKVYPGEIQGLTTGINTFIDSERAQRDRYRNTLADLAHSLKTPLAVLKAGIDKETHDESGSATLHEQIDRMKQIVDYQLQRAAASGRTTLGTSVPLLPNIERLVASLQKVYMEKHIQCDIAIDDQLVFPGEEGDLLELTGNLLENAFKWASQHINISATVQISSANETSLRITVEDDGAGIPLSRRDEVLQRGKRADESVAGHGIGLSVVQDIVNVYGGSLQIDTSQDLGGAKLVVVIPLH